MVKGGEREEVLPVNYSPNPLPFLRPETRATVLMGRPSSVRKHRMTIAPLDAVWAKYKIAKNDLKESIGPYSATIQLIAGMVPVNLIREIQDVGFDYNLSAQEVAQRVVDGHSILWERTIPLAPGIYAKEIP